MADSFTFMGVFLSTGGALNYSFRRLPSFIHSLGNGAKKFIGIFVFCIKNMQKNVRKHAYSTQVYAFQVIQCIEHTKIDP